MPIDLAADQIPAKPASFILEVGLISELRGAERLPKIVGRDELSTRIHAANRPHGKHGRPTFVEQRSCKRSVVSSVRIPMPIQATEARGRERLVDRRITGNPG